MNQDLVDLALLDHKNETVTIAATAVAAAAATTTTGKQTNSSAITPTNMADNKHTSPSGAGDTAAAPAVCPVDHKSREAWLQQAQNAAPSSASSPSPSSPHAALPPHHPTIPPPPSSSSALSESREISTIPRTTDTGPSACPANHEAETGADKASGNWIYPSEKMFFDAMRRKGHDSARTADMATIVPIHNAVNERAWKQIKEWEAPYTGSGPGQCGGPKLHSFMGDSRNMTPKARINTLLGYTAPFDRHDWVVDRCGTKVDYVIDFYEGRKNAAGQQVSFYLDVRPKLNSWEGVKMRFLKGFGLV